MQGAEMEERQRYEEIANAEWRVLRRGGGA